MRRELTSFRALSDPILRAERTETILARALETRSPLSILDELETEYCHLDAHSLGKLLYRRDGFMAAVQTCKSRCTGGCFHGVLMEMGVAENSVGASKQFGEHKILNTPEALCDLMQAHGVNDYLCSHGLGHMYTSINVRTIEAGVNHCDKFTDWFRRLHCQHGVFMEMVYFGEQALDAKKSIFDPCENYHDAFPSMCYRYRGAWLYLKYKEKILPEMYNACESLPSTSRQYAGCAHGVGFSQTGVVSKTPIKLGTVCQWDTVGAQRMCIDGALTIALDNPIQDRRAACHSLRFEREYCLSIIESPAGAGLFTKGRAHDYTLYLAETSYRLAPAQP